MGILRMVPDCKASHCCVHVSVRGIDRHIDREQEANASEGTTVHIIVHWRILCDPNHDTSGPVRYRSVSVFPDWPAIIPDPLHCPRYARSCTNFVQSKDILVTHMQQSAPVQLRRKNYQQNATNGFVGFRPRYETARSVHVSF